MEADSIVCTKDFLCQNRICNLIKIITIFSDDDGIAQAQQEYDVEYECKIIGRTQYCIRERQIEVPLRENNLGRAY